MPQLQFDEENNFNPNFNGFDNNQSKGMAAWLKKQGLAKDENTAQNILIFIIMLSFGLTAILLNKRFNDSNTNQSNLTEEAKIIEEIILNESR